MIGKIGAKILDKIGLDDLIDKTAIGRMIKKGDMSTVGFFETIIKLFIYIIFAAIILDILKIQIITDFVSQIILYIPLIISALLVLIIGILLVDFLVGMIRKILIAIGIDDKIIPAEFFNINIVKNKIFVSLDSFNHKLDKSVFDHSNVNP